MATKAPRPTPLEERQFFLEVQRILGRLPPLMYTAVYRMRKTRGMGLTPREAAKLYFHPEFFDRTVKDILELRDKKGQG